MRGQQIAITAVILALAAAPAAAQGNGRKVGHGRNGPVTTTSSTTAPSAVAIRQFGAWLDDASLLEPGRGWAAVSLGHARSPGGRQTDFPVIDGAVGLTRRAQFGATVPYYRLHFTDGSKLSGFGDVYLNAKLSILNPAETRSAIGVAVTPLVEVLSHADPDTGGRWFWGAPVSVEFRAPNYRVYASAGYFSRGAVFGSGAVEVPLTSRVIVTGALIHMRSVNDARGADTLGLSKTRLDMAGATAYILTPAIAVFGSVGRTISTLDVTGTSLLLNAGVSITFAGRARP